MLCSVLGVYDPFHLYMLKQLCNGEPTYSCLMGCLSLCCLLIVFLIPFGCRMESRILENLLCIWPSFIYNWGRIDL